VPERRLFKTNDPAVLRALEGAMHKEPFRTPLAIHVRGSQGEVPVFEVRSLRDGRTARVTGDVPLQSAERAPLSREILEDKLGRLGDTPFALAELTIELPSDAMLPLSSLNRARRALTVALLEQAEEGSRAHPTTDVSAAQLLAHAQPPDRAPAPGGLFVLCRNLGQAKAAIESGADGVYLDFLELTGTGQAVRELRAMGARFVGVAPPRIRKPGEEKIDRYLEGLAPDAVLVRGLGALRERSTSLRIGDFSLNVTNRISAAEVLGRGLAAFTPSFDLDASQLEALLATSFGAWAEVVVHHPMPLFHMEHCVIAALLSEGKDHRTCGRPCDRHQVSLRDRAGVDHPVEADVGCRNTVFHAAAQSAATMVPRLQTAGVRRFRVELVRESPEETSRVVHAYRDLLDGKAAPAEVWRGLRTEAGYGVVRGSLRVLA
jgi:putative protease